MGCKCSLIHYEISMPRTVRVGEGRENTSIDTGFGGPVLGQWLRAVHIFGCLCGGLGDIYIWNCIRRLQIFQHHTTWESYILPLCYSSICLYLLRVWFDSYLSSSTVCQCGNHTLLSNAVLMIISHNPWRCQSMQCHVCTCYYCLIGLEIKGNSSISGRHEFGSRS